MTPYNEHERAMTENRCKCEQDPCVCNEEENLILEDA